MLRLGFRKLWLAETFGTVLILFVGSFSSHKKFLLVFQAQSSQVASCGFGDVCHYPISVTVRRAYGRIHIVLSRKPLLKAQKSGEAVEEQEAAG